MKKLLLIGVCLIILSSFASAKDIFGFAPELDMWSEDSVGEESTSAGAGSEVLEGIGGQTVEMLIGDEVYTEGAAI